MRHTGFLQISLLLYLLCVVHPLSGAQLRLPNGRKVDTSLVNNERYVAMQELATALDLDSVFSYETGGYTLLTADRQQGLTVTVKAGSRKIIVNKEERFIPHPIILRDGVLFLPVDPMVAILSSPRLRPDDRPSCQLIEVSFAPHLDFTRLHFLFSSPTEAVTTDTCDKLELPVVFPDAELGLPGHTFTVDTPQVERVNFVQRPEPGKQVEARIVLRCSAMIEVFTLESGRRVIVDIIDRLAREGGADLPQEQKEFFSTSRILIDPAHGGSDSGAVSGDNVEKKLTLSYAKSLKKLLSARGFEVKLARSSDVDLPLLARLNAINSSSPDIVVSLHTSWDEDPSAPACAGFFVLPGKNKETNADLPVRGLYTPTAEEIRSSAILAGTIMNSFAESTSLKAAVLELPHLLPLSRIMAPSVLIDIRNPGRTDQGEVVSALNTGILRYFRALFLDRAPENLPVSMPETGTTTLPDTGPATSGEY